MERAKEWRREKKGSAGELGKTRYGGIEDERKHVVGERDGREECSGRSAGEEDRAARLMVEEPRGGERGDGEEAERRGEAEGAGRGKMSKS
jgi:hypothetical protein